MSKYPIRQLENIVSAICKKHHYKCVFYCEGWIINIQSKSKSIFIYGYSFSCNNAVVSNICCDKSATSAILSANKIACFEHIYFTKDFYTEKELLTTFHSNKNNVVIKPNTGTSGIDVYHCTKQDDFLKKSMHIIKHYPGLAISPFYNYNIEYRVVVNNGKIILSLCKEKSHIIGDGINNVESLSKQKNINPTTILGVDTNYLPAQHEKVYINWKHNLSQGGVIAEMSPSIEKQLAKIVVRICKIIDIKFFSIDFAIIDDKPIVVEINSGVMLEKYSSFDQQHYQRAYKIYEDIITELLK